MSRLRLLALLPLFALLAACSSQVLDPSGDVAMQQRNLLLESFGLMLIIIIPVMILIGVFAWRYRQSNARADYDPEWDHSTHLELAIWAAPLLIVVCLGALTWLGTHLLDPYRDLGRIAPGKQVAAGTKPLTVDVVALDWKWLFIYPDYGIATVNEMAAPLDRPIDFKITASSVMNSFYVPAIAGQIYAMPGMETKLHAVVNKPGDFKGFSANYSGAGFSGMHFVFKGMNTADFDKWIASAKASGQTLDRATYLKLAAPSENTPVIRYASVGDHLYDAILNECVEPGSMCISQMAAIDAAGGLGVAGIHNILPVAANAPSDSAPTGPRRTYVANICTEADGGYGVVKGSLPAPHDGPLVGAGLRPPGMPPAPLQSAAVLSLSAGASPNS